MSLIIFDMDGVLIDTSNSYRVAIKETFEYFAKKEMTFEEITEAKNLGGLNNDWDLTEYLLKKHSINVDYKQIVDVFQGIYLKLLPYEKSLVDARFISELSQNHHLAIFTGRPRPEALFALERHNVIDYFYPVITMDDLPQDKQKPNTLGIEMIKEQIQADKIYYLGDTVDDMICAKNAKVIGIGVLPPQDKSDSLKERLQKAGAVVVLNETKELENALK